MRSFTERRTVALVAVGVLVAGLWLAPPEAAAQTPRQMYTRSLARERELLDASRKPTLKQLRGLAAAYLRVVSRHPRSAYSDNALWQAAGLHALAFERYRQESDKRQAQRLIQRLRREYPSSSLNARAGEVTRALARAPAKPAAARPAERTAKAAPLPAHSSAAPPLPAFEEGRAVAAEPVPAAAAPALPTSSVSTLVGVSRTEIGNVVRVTVELDAEVAYREERIDNPARVFFDLRGVRPGPTLGETAINYGGDVIRQVRLGTPEDETTRIAMDLDGVSRYSVFTLYNPYRLVVDFERTTAPTALPTATAGTLAATSHVPVAAATRPVPERSPEPASSRPAATLPATPAPPSIAAPPAVPAANAAGNYSLARQLGLGVGRVVIDAGHGGHDPGAKAHRVTEAELVLDVALRLEKLLLKQRGMEVVMTRRTDVFIPLEERTAIANRSGADLFLSIHANASRNTSARGIETYYLNFASNPEAEAVAARENSASSRTLHALPDIVKAIALNNKLDESRDFAELVQKAMAKRLRPQNASLKSLGVKRAPFVVLIGAGMPSVLAEISFVTNRQEAALLRTGAYRQRIAQALCDAILQYQRSLKNVGAVADAGQK